MVVAPTDWRREQHSKLIPDGYASLSRRAAVLRRSLSMFYLAKNEPLISGIEPSTLGNRTPPLFACRTIQLFFSSLLRQGISVLAAQVGIEPTWLLHLNSFQDCALMTACILRHNVRTERWWQHRSALPVFPSCQLNLEYYMLYALEPLMGVEPTFSAWKADVLPLNHNGAMGVELETTPCIRLSGSSISEMKYV